MAAEASHKTTAVLCICKINAGIDESFTMPAHLRTGLEYLLSFSNDP